MIECKKFYDSLIKKDIDFFAGVPDSLLKDFCAYIQDNSPNGKNIIAANEGNAVALASGYHLATGKFAAVYMQNSGLGNSVNPLTSLADGDVYSIPMLLIVGWRGEPGIKDEPQHVKIGKVTLPMLETLGIPYSILDSDFEAQIKEAKEYMEKNNATYALVVKKGTFEKYKSKSQEKSSFSMRREEAIEEILKHLSENDVIVSTTGKTSRELFELRESKKQSHEKDFLTVGSMGHSSSIALGISLQKPKSKVYCFDGDGALIMHMGALSVIGQLKPLNFRHIIFNNFSHESVGGQKTASSNIDIPSLALANGYHMACSARTKKEIIDCMEKLKKSKGPSLLEIKIMPGSRENLGRPTTTTIQNKTDFMNFLKGD